MASPPHCTDVQTLDHKAARELWNWQLRRQGLSPDSRFTSVRDIAHAALGLHAARLPSPFSTVLARSATTEVARSLFSRETRATVLTVRCMRKTLHALPLPMVAAAHAATLHFRERDALRSISNAGLGAHVIARITAAVVDLLEQTGPLFHRDIERMLVGSGTTVIGLRLALKLAWERGVLSYVNDTTGWNREHRTFGVTGVVHPGLDMAMDRRFATRGLVGEYFDRYGPATIADVMWWSGLSRSAVTTAMSESSRDWITVYGPWSESPMYMYRDRFEEYVRTGVDERQTGLNLLAHEDVALKAYFETRTRYLGTVPARRAFNQIGEVLPTIVHNGEVVGTWSWEASTRTVVWSVARGFGSPRLRAMVKRQASAVGGALREAWSPGRISAET
jgi:hypothetical protein